MSAQTALIGYFVIGGISAVIALIGCVFVNEEYMKNGSTLEWDAIFRTVATAYMIWPRYWYVFFFGKDK